MQLQENSLALASLEDINLKGNNMANLLFLGGDFKEAGSYYPEQAPEEGDVIMCNPSSQDMYFSEMPPICTINLTDMTHDIYLGIVSENIFQSLQIYERYDLAQYIDYLTLT